MILQDIISRYPGVNPDVWEEVSELIEFETNRLKEFYMTVMNEIIENGSTLIDAIELVEEYEDLLEEYDRQAEETEHLYYALDSIKDHNETLYQHNQKLHDKLELKDKEIQDLDNKLTQVLQDRKTLYSSTLEEIQLFMRQRPDISRHLFAEKDYIIEEQDKWITQCKKEISYLRDALDNRLHIDFIPY